MELQVEARNLEIRKVWQDKIDEEKIRLERHHAGFIHHLRVTIEGTSSHREGGYELRVVASIPNDTVVVKRKGEKVVPLLVDAFNTLGLQLKELQRKKRQSYKVQPEVATSAGGEGVVKSIFPYESYGFIVTPQGQEIYFHENALKDVAMNQLSEGDGVRFGEAQGDKGPCAAWVKLAK
ncbi:MAG: cold shock domain-containing protein [Desulfobulbaceae bacterium]|jgi:cold shock CspA family protein/ribosome-associated translation inhibitor RaiA|nr:cold shock domain-containing protein [Desulfobulbaceae bacterium]HKJ13979.1 cold shock domain-containing protein [Desulfobulbales bacterium]MDH3542036.1 cold shock domain-containing protein [Desulfobulbaceae bacterium]MDH3776521.1 cold shock domain-containing protein [Desulfobulbaceae bacterium]MDH3783253.1 cold shock domain-containing protein [Desulfobulbaceae bacterium]